MKRAASGFANEPQQADHSTTRQKMRERLLRTIRRPRNRPRFRPGRWGVEIMAPPGMEEMTSQLQSLFQNLRHGRTCTCKLKVQDALKLLQEGSTR